MTCMSCGMSTRGLPLKNLTTPRNLIEEVEGRGRGIQGEGKTRWEREGKGCKGGREGERIIKGRWKKGSNIAVL